MNSKLILGTAQFGLKYGINNSKGKTPIKEALKILDYCKNEGIKALDTAVAYGSSEKVIGDLMLKSFAEDDFAITTKIKYKQGCDLDFLARQSLKNLRRSTIETLLFHSFDDYLRYSSHSNPREVHSRGVSVYANTEISQVVDDPEVEVIQCPFNLLDNESKRGEILRKAKLKGIEVQVRSVYLQGLFFRNRESLPKVLSPLKPYLLQLDKICKSTDCKIQDLALGYCVSKKYVDKIVIGVESLDQLKANIKSLNCSITRESFDIIDAISVRQKDLLNPSKW